MRWGSGYYNAPVSIPNEVRGLSKKEIVFLYGVTTIILNNKHTIFSFQVIWVELG